MIEWLLYLYAESPVHAGAADSVGSIDLPIQREATTGLPVIWGQSLKGALRQAADESTQIDDPAVVALFGQWISPQGDADEPVTGAGDRELSAGLLSVGDAQLVAHPVPTLRRTFAWVTSPLVLSRVKRKYDVLRAASATTLAASPDLPRVADDAGATGSPAWIGERSEVLGHYLVPLGATAQPQVSAWAERIGADAFGNRDVLDFTKTKLARDLLVVNDGLMPRLSRECTEVVARVHLDKNKKVANGPFYGEYLPVETLLVAPLSYRANGAGKVGSHVEAVQSLLQDGLLRLGGDETVGKGLLWTALVGGPS